MSKFLAFIPGIGPFLALLTAVPAQVYKYIAIALACLVAVLYVDHHASMREKAKCSAAALVAQRQAVEQDLKAEQESHADTVDTLNSVQEQKDKDDVELANLRAATSGGKGRRCILDDDLLRGVR